MYIQDSVILLHTAQLLMSVKGIDLYRTHLRKIASIYLSDLAMVYSTRSFMKDEIESVPHY